MASLSPSLQAKYFWARNLLEIHLPKTVSLFCFRCRSKFINLKSVVNFGVFFSHISRNLDKQNENRASFCCSSTEYGWCEVILARHHRRLLMSEKVLDFSTFLHPMSCGSNLDHLKVEAQTKTKSFLFLDLNQIVGDSSLETR